jgi:eukaryotic-like serine/threonine-protein kinase
MIGRQISRYRVISRIGAGGMGEVYLAEDSSLGRKVALKLLPSAIAADANARQRLLREAQAAASLDQPFICKVYEAGVDADVAFIAMEYVDGTTIRDRLLRGPIPIDDAVRLGGEIADALEFAHARRVIHRDLKPANVMITPDGHAKVMDFGLARQLADPAEVETIAQTTTASGTVLGTPAYMSPEQLRGEQADSRSDIFAFGLVLYEMLTGSHAYPHATSAATAGAILHEPPPMLSGRLPGVPPLLDHLIGRCLDKNPGRRYQSLRDVHLELEAIARGTTTATMRPVVRSPRRWPLVLAAGIVLIAAYVVWQRPDLLPGSRNALAFKERDWLLVADFDNVTGDKDFDRSLRLGLEVGIAQSQFVNVLPVTRVQDALRRMQKTNVERLDEALATEVALREGARGVLACSIAQVGDRYPITARLVDPKTRTAVLTESVTADRKDRVLYALDTLATRIRRQLGESLKGLSSQGVALPQATTASLQALKLYADSFRANRQTDGDEFLRQAIALDPDFALAHAELGLHYFFTVDKEYRTQGEQHIEKALALVDRLTPKERLWIAALAEDSRGNRERAVDAYRAYLGQYPDDSRAWFRLGWTQMAGLGQFEQAIEAFTRATAINPSDVASQINLATSLGGLRRDQEARVAYEKAFAISPRDLTSANVNHEYGFTLVRLGDLPAAEEAFRKAIAFDDPSINAYGHRSLGMLEMLRGRYVRGAEELRQAIAINRSQNNTVGEYRNHLLLARGLEAAGQTAAARAEVDIARALVSKLSLGPEWLYMLGELDARAERLSEARRILALTEKAAGNNLTDSVMNRSLSNDQAYVALVRGEILQAEGHADEAIPLLESATQVPDLAAPRHALASALAAAGRTADAIKQFEAIIARQAFGDENQEQWLRAHVVLGGLYEKLGRTNDARGLYQRLITRLESGDPNLPLRTEASARLARLPKTGQP